MIREQKTDLTEGYIVASTSVQWLVKSRQHIWLMLSCVFFYSQRKHYEQTLFLISSIFLYEDTFPAT